MKNQQIEAAWAYHNRTKHSYESIRANRHYLDWENQPLLFKIYPKLEPMPLPEPKSTSSLSALSAIATVAAGGAALTLQSLSEMLFLSAGITRRRTYPGGEILFRAAACTGALYHIDLYLVCGDLDGLEAGVYHFSPEDFSLRKLRAGDYRSALVSAGGAEPALAHARCIIASASTFWRNAWKYQARAYRHCYWDNGTILANLLAAAASHRVPAKIVMGFVDDAVSCLLGLDRQGEAPLSLVALGESANPFNVNEPPPLTPLTLETLPLSKRIVDYPPMRGMHEASSLASPEEVKAWRGGVEKAEGERMKDEGERAQSFPLQLLGVEDLTQDSLEDVIRRRGSTREFSRAPISFAQLSTMLDRATRGIDADFLSPQKATLNELYLIVHAVEGLAAGAYVYRRAERALEILKPGDFRREAGYLGLSQEIPADCSVNVYFLTELAAILERFGNRGYRAAELEAAIMGGRLYLAAYAQRLGASGLTFFDDDVIEFFSPHAKGKSVMFLIALGKSALKPGRTA